MFNYYTKLGANGLNMCNSCRSSCHEVVLEFFATNAPNPPPLHPKLMFVCVS